MALDFSCQAWNVMVTSAPHFTLLNSAEPCFICFHCSIDLPYEMFSHYMAKIFVS